MAEKWTRDEDELLILFQSNGLTSKKIYEKFGNRFNNRSQRAIENRILYLNAPLEERKKYDEDTGDMDRMIGTVEKSAQMICNRLDTSITRINNLNEVIRILIEEIQSLKKQEQRYAEEMKALLSEMNSNTGIIKNEIKKYRR
ncbi:hypothetical protein [Floccifex sp.]|uniref:hypothetical protein n=1 Tax=Floccifex sp. TaxID=2815810 RepID=UPI003EF63AAA